MVTTNDEIGCKTNARMRSGRKIYSPWRLLTPRYNFFAVDEELRRMLESLHGEFAAVRQEMRGELAAMRQELHGELTAMRQEMKQEFAAVRQENAAAHVETRHEFNIVVERMDRGFDLLAEGTLNIDQKLDREASDIRGEMRRGFADTHDLIRFTWSQLS